MKRRERIKPSFQSNERMTSKSKSGANEKPVSVPVTKQAEQQQDIESVKYNLDAFEDKIIHSKTKDVLGVYYIIVIDPFSFLLALPQLIAREYVWAMIIWVLNAITVALLLSVMFLTHPHHVEYCCYPGDLERGAHGSCNNEFSAISREMKIRHYECSRWSLLDLIFIFLIAGLFVASYSLYIWRSSHNMRVFPNTEHGKAWMFCISPLSFVLDVPARMRGVSSWKTVGYAVLGTVCVITSILAALSIEENNTFGCYKSESIYDWDKGTCDDADAPINSAEYAHLRRSKPILGMFGIIVTVVGSLSFVFMLWIYIRSCMLLKDHFRFIELSSATNPNLVVVK